MDCKDSNQIYVGKERLALMILKKKECSIDHLASLTSVLIKSLFIQEQKYLVQLHKVNLYDLKWFKIPNQNLGNENKIRFKSLEIFWILSGYI